MELRSFVGPDLKETLARVKRDLGPEAVILSTRSRRVAGGDHTGPRREIEVIAARSATAGTGWEPEPGAGEAGVAIPSLVAALTRELRELTRLMRQPWPDPAYPRWLKSYPQAEAFYLRLAAAGLSPWVREKWLGQVHALLTGHPDPEAEARAGWQALLSLFSVTVGSPPPGPPPRGVALVGATGVGKTTTLAKLALRAALAESRRVGLISLDQERVGAMEQLSCFARLADLPLYPAGTRQELAEALERLGQCEVIFIDTPGVNPCQPGVSEKLRHQLGGLPIDCHLLLATPASEAHLAQTLKAFRGLPLASLLLTKVDETTELVGCVNRICQSGLPVSYLTTGPRVPEDLEAATPSRLACLLLDLWREAPLFSGARLSGREVFGHAEG